MELAAAQTSRIVALVPSDKGDPMALHTGNPYIDALAGAKWTGDENYSNGKLVLTVSFETGNGGAWNTNVRPFPHIDGEIGLFFDALHAWESVANISVLRVEPSPADFYVQKVTSIPDNPTADGGAETPDDSTHNV